MVFPWCTPKLVPSILLQIATWGYTINLDRGTATWGYAIFWTNPGSASSISHYLQQEPSCTTDLAFSIMYQPLVNHHHLLAKHLSARNETIIQLQPKNPEATRSSHEVHQQNHSSCNSPKKSRNAAPAPPARPPSGLIQAQLCFDLGQDHFIGEAVGAGRLACATQLLPLGTAQALLLGPTCQGLLPARVIGAQGAQLIRHLAGVASGMAKDGGCCGQL